MNRSGIRWWARTARASLIPVLALSLVLGGCGDDSGVTPPQLLLNISATPTQGEAPLDVAFSANATGGETPVTYAWTIGTETTPFSTDPDPSYTFTESGAHVVSLTATDAIGHTATQSLTIDVYASLAVEVAADITTGLAPLLVNLSGTVTGGNPPYTHAWNFGDGGTADLAAVSHLYESAGTYEARLTVTDALGATATASVEIVVGDDDMPIAAISASPTVGVAPLTTSFQAVVSGGNAPFTYAWIFGDTGTAATESASHMYATEGSYTAILVVTDADGDEASDTVEINVASDSQPVVEIVADVLSGIEPLTVQLSANTAGGNEPLAYAWDFDGDSVTDSMVANPTHVFAAGAHTVSVTITDNDGDSASDTEVINVLADTVPTVSASAVPAAGPVPLAVQLSCTATGGNGPFTYLWDLGDGTNSTLANPSHTYTQIGVYTATCTVQDANGDSASDTAVVDAQDANDAPVITDISVTNGGLGLQPHCAAAGQTQMQLSVTATDPNGDPLSYEWVFDSIPAGAYWDPFMGPFNDEHVMNPTTTPLVAGTYVARVFVRDPNGYVASQTVTILVEDPSQVVVISPTTLTSGNAGDAYADPLVVRAQTACEIPVRWAALSWSGSNVTLSSYDGQTDTNGEASADIALGCDASVNAVVTAALTGSGSATFNIPVDIGPATTLTVTPSKEVAVHDSSWPTPAPVAMDVHVAVTDQCGNLATGSTPVNVTVNQSHETGQAWFNALDGDDDWSGTVNGEVTLHVYSRDPGRVTFTASAAGLSNSGGWVTESWDFEQSNGGLVSMDMMGAGQVWSWGEPTANPPGGAHSGSQAWATVLDGDIDISPMTPETVYSLRANLDLSSCVGSLPVTLSFWEFHETLGETWAHVGTGMMWGPFQELTPANANANYDGINPMWGYQGYQGSSGGWQELQFTLANECGNQVELNWILWAENWNSQPAFGWAIDDLTLTYFSDAPWGSFTGGPLGSGTVVTGLNGVEGCGTSPGEIQVTGTDFYGNPAGLSQVTLTEDGAGGLAYVQVSPGQLVGSTGTDVTVETDTNGTAVIRMTDDTAEMVTFTLQTPDGMNPTTMVSFSPVGAEVCNDGADNDCNGAVDCDDSACTGDPWCIPESQGAGNCLDGADNDHDGLQDCEETSMTTDPGFTACADMPDTDPSCQSDWSDHAGMGMYDTWCDGMDDITMGYVDLFSCSCVTDMGCDNINDMNGTTPYRCYTERQMVGMPFCGPPCNDPDLANWYPPGDPNMLCTDITMGMLPTCDFATGMCMP